MGILLSEHELYKLHQKSKWLDEKGDWDIPMFTFNPKAKDISFPTINARARVDQAKEERELQLLGAGDDGADDAGRNADSGFRQAGNFKGKRSNAKKKSQNYTQSRNNENVASVGPANHNYSGLYNHSADENSQEAGRAGEASWMEDRLSQDNHSHNNARDSHSNGGIQIRNKNVDGGSVSSLQGGKNAIIPERRRKYLGAGSDDNYLAGGAPSVGQ